MPDEIILLVAAIVIVVILLLTFSYLKKKRSSSGEIEAAAQRPRGVPILRGEGVEAPRRAGRNVRARMRAAATREDDDDEEEDLLADEIAMPEGKVGVKKRKKLELKAEKRKERERELEDREDRKKRQQEIEDNRKKEELKQKEEEQRQEEEEKALKEEQEKRELEEYMKLKETFAVEEEGYDEEESVETHKFQEFMDYIKSEKVVLLEDLASRFKLKTQDAIDRVQELLAQEWLTGVIDDRGKFICITKDELESVAQFIRQRGRVSISELVECSNTLINLQPDSTEEVPVTS